MGGQQFLDRKSYLDVFNFEIVSMQILVVMHKYQREKLLLLKKQWITVRDWFFAPKILLQRRVLKSGPSDMAAKLFNQETKHFLTKVNLKL